MKIVIVSQYYSPEPVPIPAALAHGLVLRGHKVRVLTAFPSYPAGKIADGYKQKLVHTEKDGDVTVRRVPVFVSHSKNAVARLLNYASFSLSSLTAWGFTRGADVVYVYATQMTAAVAPAWWRRVAGLPYVLHVQDLWPESITGSSMVRKGVASRLIDAVLTPWLKNMYRHAGATIAIGPGMAKLLAARGAPSPHTVFNWAPSVVEAHARRSANGDGLKLMYAGNIGEMQDLETVIRAMALVPDLDGLELAIVGSGVAEASVRELADTLGLTNVRFHGRVPQDQMTRFYETSDFQLVTLADLPVFRVTVPSKLQASLASGIPVISTVGGDVADLVSSNSVGLTSPAGDAGALADTFRRAHAMSALDRHAMGERAIQIYEETMTMDIGIDRIEKILADAAGTKKRTHSDD
jgi:colanic acid biosynthesis glycosyl transferase WcaI